MAKLLSNTRVYGTATVDTQLFVKGFLSAHSTVTGSLQVSGGIGVAGGGFFAGTVTATNFVGSVSGASGSLAGGTAGQVPYQVSPGVTDFFGPGTAGQILVSAGAAAPVYTNTASIYVGNAVTATNVRGGLANQFVYQTAPGVTAFINTASMYVGRSTLTDNVAGGLAGQFLYQSAPNVTAFINTASMYVGRAVIADTVVGGGSTVNTVQATLSATHFLTFVDSNNATATAETIYTTSSFTVNAGTGHVGLGTATPSDRLELSGAADAARIRLTNTTLGRSSILGHGSGGFYWQPTNNSDTFELRDSSGSGQVAFVPNSSNFGIGTTGPSTKLHVAGAAGDTRIRVSANDGTNYRGFEVFAGGTQKGGMYYRTTEGNVFQIWGPNTSNAAIYIDSNNTVDLLGTTSVHSTATGAFQVTGGIGIGGGGFFGGTVTATNFVGAFSGSSAQVETRQSTSNVAHFLTFVDSNNASSTAEVIYTTSSFTVNPSTGFVGMGTSSPSQRLTVSGQTLSDSFALSNGWSLTDAGGGSGYAAVSNWVRMNGTGIYTTGNTFTDLDSNTSAYEVRGVNNDIIARYENIGAANSSRQISFLPNGGNFGLGTQSPYSRFTIVTDAATNGMSMFTSAYIATQTWGTRFWKNDIGGGIPLQIDTQSASTWYTSVRISHGQSSGHPSLRSYYETHLASDGGNVGIGTTSPNNKLHIVTGTPTGSTTPLTDTALLIDSSANQYLEFRTASASSGLMQGLVFTDNGRNAFIGFKEYSGAVAGTYGESIHLAVYDYSATDAGNGIYFGTSNTPQNGVNSVAMFIKGNGNVGVNTVNPTNKLTVSGDTKFAFTNTGLRFYESGDDARIDFVKASNDTVSARFEWNGYSSSTTHKIDYFGILLNDSAGNLTNRFHILENGNVGISNTSPSFRLDITGTARATADFRAPIFYDTDNTNFYADPASTSIFNILQVTGYVRQQTDGGTFLASDVAENNNWLFQENARGWGIFYLNKGSQSGQTFGTYTTIGAETFFIGQNAGTTMPSAWTGSNASSRVAAMISNYSGDIWAAGRIYSANSLMAPTFIDSDDQNFFVNPAGSSTINNITISGNKTFARFNSAYVFIRGTGLNNNATRYVAVNGTEISNNTNRGLTLTIINAATLAAESSTNYDTYGTPSDSTALATAIGGMTSAQIGILTSYDAWELSVNDALRNAARKHGLNKLANYSAGGSRRPYAAIFYGTSDDTNASTKDAIERMESDDADAPRALITTYITSDGAFSAIDGAYSVNALYSSNSTIEDPVVIVNSSGFVGIGTNSPDEELVVSGSSYPVVKIQGSQQPSLFLVSDGGSAEIYNAYGTLGILYQGFTPSNSSQLFYFAGNGIAYASSQLQLFDSKMVITGGGNVGIGDTSPSQRLVVSGRAVVTGGILGAETGAPDAPIWAISADYLNWGIFYNEGSPDYIEFQTGGTVTSRIALDTGAAHFGITGGGSVGIGRPSPIDTFGFGGGTFLDTLGGVYARQWNDTGRYVAIGSNSGTGWLAASGVSDLRFYVGSATAATINSSGQMFKGNFAIPYIHIGDTAPTAIQNGDLWWESDTGKLKIRYNDGSGSYWVDAVAVPDSSLFFPKAGGAITGPVVMNNTLTVNGTIKADNKITVGPFPQSTTNNNEAWFGRAADRSIGQMTVQLGQANNRTFEVVDWQWTTVIFAAGMDSLTYRGRTIPTISLQDSAPSGVKDGDLWWESDTGKLKVRYNDGSSTQWVDAMPIPDMSTYFSKGGGGIYGSVAIDGTLTVSGKIFATDTITQNYSDARLKNISGKITGALDKLSKISGYYYTANEVAEQYGYDTKKENVGVLAQEIEAVLPQAVTRAAFDTEILESGEEVSKTGEEYKTVYYERLVPLLIEAIKEQQQQIDNLVEKVKKLEGLN